MESKGLVGRVLSTTAAVTVSAAVVTGFGGLVAAAPAFAAAPTVGAPNPNQGGVGTSVKITGNNFTANSTISISMGGAAATISSGGTTSTTGVVSATITVPYSLTPGSYPVKVTDAKGLTASSGGFQVKCETLLYSSGTAPAPTAGQSMTLYYDDDSTLGSAFYSNDGGSTWTQISPVPASATPLTALDSCGGSISTTASHEQALNFTPSGSGPLVVRISDGDNDTDSHVWSSVTPATLGAATITTHLSAPGPFSTPTAVTDTATVTGSNGDPASGASIQFYVCGPLSSDGPCPLDPAKALGSAHSGATATSDTYTPAGPGTYCFSAYYSGNANYSPADYNGSSAKPGQCFTVTSSGSGGGSSGLPTPSGSGGSGGSGGSSTGGSGGSSTGGSGGSSTGGSGGGGAPSGSGVYRVGGTDRIHTAILTSQADYNDGKAGAVILARSDLFPDSLAAAPLAVKNTAPILLTPPTSLDTRTAAEISRVLLPGGTVYLLGQTSALSTDVANAVTQLGYTVVRIGGADRFATAADIAGSVGTVTKILLADGTNFPDAVSAAAACGPAGTVIALTSGGTMPDETTQFLSSNAGVPVYAVGGPAATADPNVTNKLVGADRYATSVLVAQTFFSNPTGAGMATGLDFPDALTAGPYLAAGWPMLLTDPNGIPSVVSQYLNGIKSGMSAGIVIFGGTAAVSDNAMQQAKTLLGVS